MNNKVIYIGILIILFMLITGMSEGFTTPITYWTNPLFTGKIFDKHCTVGRLENCASINPVNTQFCDVCLFDDGGPEETQIFVPKNRDSLDKRGLDGCELNTANSDEKGPIRGVCPINSTSVPLEEGGLDDWGRWGCAWLPENATTTGASRITTKKDGGCVEGAYEESSDAYAYGKETNLFTGYCKRMDYRKKRCVLPVSKLKSWAENGTIVGGLNMGEIDKIPTTGVIRGKYYTSYREGPINC